MANKRISWSDAMDYTLDHVTKTILTVIAFVVALAFASDGDAEGILCSFPFFALTAILIFQQSYKFFVDGVSNGISIYFYGLKSEKEIEKAQQEYGEARARWEQDNSATQKESGPKNIAEPNTGVKKKSPPPAKSEDNDELDSQQVPSGPEQDLTQVQKEINILTAMKNLAKESNDETTFQQLTKDIDGLKEKRSKLRKMVGDN